MISRVTQSDILEQCRVAEEQHDNTLSCVEKSVAVVHNPKPCEVNIGSYNTGILKLFQAHMNTQFVTGAYAMLTYLAFYLCKPEHTMSELMIKASKKLMIKILEEKCI